MSINVCVDKCIILGCLQVVQDTTRLILYVPVSGDCRYIWKYLKEYILKFRGFNSVEVPIHTEKMLRILATTTPTTDAYFARRPSSTQSTSIGTMTKHVKQLYADVVSRKTIKILHIQRRIVIFS